MFYFLWRRHSPATEEKVQASWTCFFSRANKVKTFGLVQQLILRMLRDLILQSCDLIRWIEIRLNPVTALSIMILQKRMTLNKRLHNNGLTFKLLVTLCWKLIIIWIITEHLRFKCKWCFKPGYLLSVFLYSAHLL